MKKVNVEMKRNDINGVAKELGIKFVGVKTPALVEAINNKIDELKPVKVKPSLQGVGFKVDEYVTIDGSKLTGRATKLNGRYAIVKEITQRGFMRVILVNDKNGQLQGCMVRMPVEALAKIETQLMVVA